MNRQLMILITCLLVSVAVYADDGLPIVEVKADRTIIYPQRMELNGEETLMDLRLQPPHRQCTSEWRRKTDSHSDEGQGYRQDSSV